MHPYETSLHVEKKLLSLYECGCYISTQDIVNLALAMGLDLPFKKRSTLLQNLFQEVQKNATHQAFLNVLCTLLDTKQKALSSLISLYPATGHLFQAQLHRINATKSYYRREFSLHVKEYSDES